MAQWVGQFSGRTHGTLVEDLESGLRAQVNEYLMVAAESDRASRLVSLRAAAKRVHHARVKCLSARLVAKQSLALSAQLRAKHGREIESLQRRLEALRQASPDAILVEFGAMTH